jgi:hypothetical protein
MTRLSAPQRTALVVWLVIAVIVWNGLYDLRITLGIRDYLLRQALHDAGRGPAVVLSDAMRATVRDAVAVASLWAGILLGAAVWTVVHLRRAGGDMLGS